MSGTEPAAAAPRQRAGTVSSVNQPDIDDAQVQAGTQALPRGPEERPPVCLARVPGLEIGCRCGSVAQPGWPACGTGTGVTWTSLADEIAALLTYAGSVHDSSTRLAGLDRDDLPGGAALARARRGGAMRLEQIAFALLRLPDDLDAEELAALMAAGLDIDSAVDVLTSTADKAAAGVKDPDEALRARREAAEKAMLADGADPSANQLLSQELGGIARRYGRA